MNKSFQTLLATEMDRRQFLIYLGILLLAVTGITGIMNSFSNIVHPKAEKGYGAKPYGK